MAAGGRAALEALKETRQEFDVILMDHDMPDLSGPECMQIIRGKHDHTPILLISGYPPESLSDSAVLHADAVLYKPVELSEVEQQMIQLSACARL